MLVFRRDHRLYVRLFLVLVETIHPHKQFLYIILHYSELLALT